jgi:hypothetical protein
MENGLFLRVFNKQPDAELKVLTPSTIKAHDGDDSPQISPISLQKSLNNAEQRSKQQQKRITSFNRH